MFRPSQTERVHGHVLVGRDAPDLARAGALGRPLGERVWLRCAGRPAGGA